jgi:hypothetical protein
MCTDDWLYMIQGRDHRRQHESIYRIGRTNDLNRRINEYHPYSQIIDVFKVDNNKKCEREFIKEFKSDFELRNDIGREYFEGDERDMIFFLIIRSQSVYLIEKKRLIWIITWKLKIKG